MFKDKTNAILKAGKGGDGRVALKSIGAKKRADGGDGGVGGDFYLEGDSNLYDLSFINKDQTFRADNGEIGGVNNSTGKNAKDYVLKVPIATNILNKRGDLVARIDKPGQRILLLKGGKGGKGNLAFRKGGQESLYEFTPGRDGEVLEAELELELVADVIFIGLPNAGKSSLLNELTNAKAKVASYAFTTIIPKLGRMNSVTLMDLPGLIERTFEGKGLGTNFVKHTKSAKLVLHFVSLENPNVVESYNVIRTELKNIDQRLYDLPEIVVLTKSDLIEDEAIIKKAIADFKKLKIEALVSSIADEASLEKLSKKLEALLG